MSYTMTGDCTVLRLDTGHEVYGHGEFGGSRAEAPKVALATSGVCVLHTGRRDGCGKTYRVTAANLSRRGGACTLRFAEGGAT